MLGSGVKHVGLALRPETVDLVEASKGTLVQTSQVPIQGPEPAEVLTAIRAAVDGASLTSRKMVVSLPSQDVLLRFFTLPMLPKNEWEAAIKFEARKHIPFRTEELVWDYHAFEDRDRKQVAVVFAAIKKDRFERIWDWLLQAGVEPTCIEPQNVSLARLVAAAYPKARQEFVGVVELDDRVQMGHIAIVKDQLPYLARDVTLGPRVFPMMKQPAPPGAGGLPVEQPAGGDQRHERLLSELRLSLDFFTREYPSASITRLLIYGGEGTVTAWCAGLAEQLHCPVEMGVLPLKTQGGDAGSLPAASSIGVAIPSSGLSAKIDFLARRTGKAPVPGDIQSQLRVVSSKGLEVLESLHLLGALKSLAKPVLVQVVAAAIGLGVFAYVSHRQVTQAQAELAVARQAQGTSGSGVADADEHSLKVIQYRVNEATTMLRNLFEGRVPVTEKLAALSEALPEGLWLEGLQYKNRLQDNLESQASLNLKGACFLPQRAGEELEVIGEFSEQLKKDLRFFRGFEVAQLGNIVSAEDARTQTAYRAFQLNCDARSIRQ